MLTQLEADIEKYVLVQLKTLSDGTKAHIFTRNDRDRSGMFSYNCRLCRVAGLLESVLQAHISGKKHRRKLAPGHIPGAAEFQSTLMPRVKQTSIIRGAEPPPVVSKLEIQCQKQPKPTLGLEYVIEVIGRQLKEPVYICSLCDKTCDPRNIIPQITSHSHRMKYLVRIRRLKSEDPHSNDAICYQELHFPNIFKRMTRIETFNTNMNFRERILASISEKIEKRFGRAKPFICESSEYETSKREIHMQLTHKNHFTQNDWPECETALFQNLPSVNFDNIFDDVSSDEDDLPQVNLVRKRFSTTNPRSRLSATSGSITSSFRPHNSNTKLQLEVETSHRLEKYKTMVDTAVEAAEKMFKLHERIPENHPKYKKEWEVFWARRFEELTLQGKNAADHDYKPEWVRYWMERVKVLLAKEIKKIKADTAKKLNLTAHDVENFTRHSRSRSPSPISVKRYSESFTRHSRSRSPSPISVKRYSESPLNVSSDDGVQHPPDKRRRIDSSSHSNGRSEDCELARKSAYRSRDAYAGYYSSNSGRQYESERYRTASPELIEEGPINLISVLRFLAALETEVGLQSAQVLVLLTDAVRAEKLKANSADDLLFVKKNVLMVETVRQTLTGKLQTKTLEPNKVAAIKRAVKNIATLLHTFKTEQADRAETQPSANSADDVPDPSSSPRRTIAKLIAQNLMEHGREHVSGAELEELIDSFLNSDEADPKSKTGVAKSQCPTNLEHQTPSASKVELEKTAAVGSNVESLSDNEVQILLRCFDDLTREEQTLLIEYLGKIEKTDSARVESLKRFVNLGEDEPATADTDIDIEREVDLGGESLVKKLDARVISVAKSLIQNSNPPQHHSAGMQPQQGMYPQQDSPANHLSQYRNGNYNYGQLTTAYPQVQEYWQSYGSYDQQQDYWQSYGQEHYDQQQ